jgi:HlyD family secretion protein
MIKNSAMRWALVATLSAAPGCAAHPADPPGHQGVVELDEATLGFDIGGRVDVMAVRRGDLVATGQELARLDDTLAKAARDARQQDVLAAQAQVALVRAGSRREDIASLQAQLRGVQSSEDALQKETDRVRSLQKTGSLPLAALDDVEARLARTKSEREALAARVRAAVSGARPEELAVSEARVAAAQSAVALEDQRLARHVLRANTKAVVMDVHVKAGEVVSPGAPVITVADPTHPYVDVFLPEGDVAGVRVGIKARVRVDSTRSAFEGAVEHVSTRTEFTPRYLFSDKERPNLVVRVRVRVDDPSSELHGGVPARVELEKP